jgi:hypothetical protein
LIVVIDQHERTAYIDILQSRLFENGVTDLELVQIITPDISSISTNQIDSVYEQAGISTE